MYKPDLTKILNDELDFLVNDMKDSMKYIGRKYVLNDSQLSVIERDFIARLAFAAIIGDEKESEKKTEKESEKKTEKSDGLSDDVINALSIVKDYCLERDCDDCIFCKSDQCKIKYTPNEWRI